MEGSFDESKEEQVSMEEMRKRGWPGLGADRTPYESASAGIVVGGRRPRRWVVLIPTNGRSGSTLQDPEVC
jgi:hypothetical protein